MESGKFTLLRWPGGNPANEWIWNGNKTVFNDPKFDQWDKDYFSKMEAFISLCKNSGATPLFQVNYAVSVMYGAHEAADLAAKWV